MSDEPLVTVITPAYNAERYIDACIRSVLCQTMQSFEQIIVDDGSIDDTVGRVGAHRDARLRCIALPHRGLSALAESYNSALNTARGSLIAILEADDLWPSDKLSRQLPLFNDMETIISWGNAVVVDEGDDPLWLWKTRRPLANQTVDMPELFRQLAGKNVLTPTVTVMVRRTALEQIGGFQQVPDTPFVDLPTWLLLSAHSTGKARHLSQILGYYRLHPAQTSQRHSEEMSTRQLVVLDEVLNRLGTDGKKRLRWDEADRRAAVASARLSEAIADLTAGHHRHASPKFWRALTETRSIQVALRSALGLLSSLISFDLLAIVRNTRRAASRASLWLSGVRSARD